MNLNLLIGETEETIDKSIMNILYVLENHLSRIFVQKYYDKFFFLENKEMAEVSSFGMLQESMLGR